MKINFFEIDPPNSKVAYNTEIISNTFTTLAKSAGITGIENHRHLDKKHYEYPFRMLMPDMSWQSSGYRYGFGGHEMDNDVKGTGNHSSFGDYGYDPRTVRRYMLEPMIAKYPSLSPYVAYADNPIVYKDPDGLNITVYMKAKIIGTTEINLYSSSEIKADVSKKTKKIAVPIYEVEISNESGSKAIFYFTRDAFRGQGDGTIIETTFNVVNDQDSFLGKIKNRWGISNYVLELRDLNDITNQTVEGMKGEEVKNRTAIQFHVLGASDGCFLCVGNNNIMSIEIDSDFNSKNIKNSSGETQKNFMQTIIDFKIEDLKNEKGDKITIKIDKVKKNNENSTQSDEVKENNAEQPTTEDNNNKNVKPVVSEPINSQIKK